jgi:ribonuclease HI
VIEIYIDGRSMGTKGSGFTVYIKHHRRSVKRSLKCPKITSNVAEAKALEYALKSIKPEFKDELIDVKTSGRYMILMLERHGNKWMREAKTNIGLVDEVRKQWDRFKSAKISTDLESEMMLSLKDSTNQVIKTGDGVFEKL